MDCMYDWQTELGTPTTKSISGKGEFGKIYRVMAVSKTFSPQIGLKSDQIERVAIYGIKWFISI